MHLWLLKTNALCARPSSAACGVWHYSVDCCYDGEKALELLAWSATIWCFWI